MYIYMRFLACHEYIKEPSVSFIAKYFNNRTSATKTKNGNEVFLSFSHGLNIFKIFQVLA